VVLERWNEFGSLRVGLWIDRGNERVGGERGGVIGYDVEGDVEPLEQGEKCLWEVGDVVCDKFG